MFITRGNKKNKSMVVKVVKRDFSFEGIVFLCSNKYKIR